MAVKRTEFGVGKCLKALKMCEHLYCFSVFNHADLKQLKEPVSFS